MSAKEGLHVYFVEKKTPFKQKRIGPILDGGKHISVRLKQCLPFTGAREQTPDTKSFLVMDKCQF